MDKYLLGQIPPHHLLSEKKYRRESASVVDEYFEEEKVAQTPFSVNINLILPDTSHLRTGLYKPPKTFTVLPQIKMEPGTEFTQSCPVSLTQTLPDFTSVFSMPHAVPVNNIFIKQEAQPEVPLTTSDTPQTHLYHMSVANDALNLVQANGGTPVANAISCTTATTTSRNLPTLTNSTRQQLGKQFQCLGQDGGLVPGHFFQAPSVTLPPSPPNSQPGSPENTPDLVNNISPPPPYEATFGLKLVQVPQLQTVSLPLGSVLTQGQVIKTVPRYNRRSNPELEKRRIHHCDYPGIKMFHFYEPFHFYCLWSTNLIDNTYPLGYPGAD